MKSEQYLLKVFEKNKLFGKQTQCEVVNSKETFQADNHEV